MGFRSKAGDEIYQYDNSNEESGESTFIGFRILPNPNHGYFTVELKAVDFEQSISIFNALGQEIWNQMIQPQTALLQINKAEFMTKGFGLYYVLIRSQDQNHIQAVLILE